MSAFRSALTAPQHMLALDMPDILYLAAKSHPRSVVITPKFSDQPQYMRPPSNDLEPAATLERIRELNPKDMRLVSNAVTGCDACAWQNVFSLRMSAVRRGDGGT